MAICSSAETTVPMGTNWAWKTTSPTCCRGRAPAPAARQRNLGRLHQLVWYPGRPARCIFRDPYQPLLNVADNSVFMVERK